MAQREILKLLKKHEDWLCSNEIAEELGVGRNSVNVQLKQMRKYDEVDYKPVRGHFNRYVYKAKEKGEVSSE